MTASKHVCCLSRPQRGLAQRSAASGGRLGAGGPENGRQGPDPRRGPCVASPTPPGGGTGTPQGLGTRLGLPQGARTQGGPQPPTHTS